MAQVAESRFKYSANFRPVNGNKLPLDLPRYMQSVDYLTKNNFAYLQGKQYYTGTDGDKMTDNEYFAARNLLIGYTERHSSTLTDTHTTWHTGSSEDLELTIFNARKYNLLCHMLEATQKALRYRVDYYVNSKLSTWLRKWGSDLMKDNYAGASRNNTVYSTAALDTKVQLLQDNKSLILNADIVLEDSDFAAGAERIISVPTLSGVVVAKCVTDNYLHLVLDGILPKYTSGAYKFTLDDETLPEIEFARNALNNLWDVRVSTRTGVLEVGKTTLQIHRVMTAGDTGSAGALQSKQLTIRRMSFFKDMPSINI